MRNRIVLSVTTVLAGIFSWLPAVSAKAEYTYVKASLGFPWVMFFVFMLMILIPFLLIIVLSWRKHTNTEEVE